jgi:hypothetical protein
MVKSEQKDEEDKQTGKVTVPTLDTANRRLISVLRVVNSNRLWPFFGILGLLISFWTEHLPMSVLCIVALADSLNYIYVTHVRNVGRVIFVTNNFDAASLIVHSLVCPMVLGCVMGFGFQFPKWLHD